MSVFGKSWRYINEGNIHIVIGIEGEDVDSNYVLRLIKEDDKTVRLIDIHKSVDFINLVMMPLVSNTSHSHLEVLEMCSEKLKVLMRDLERFRPKERMIKSKLSCFAVKTDNLTILNPKVENYCVEIKPKEGFMSPIFKKYGKCYFCLKQFLKLQENQIFHRSRYCPLDLFSGDKRKMEKALFNLSENPQNNFKIFKNGQIIFSHANKTQLHKIINEMNIFEASDDFYKFIVQILLSTKANVNSTNFTTINRQNKSYDYESGLHKQTVLYKILETQKLSEKLDISSAEPNLDSLDYVSSILETLDSETNLYNEKDRRNFLDSSKDEHLALISAIAKDCSIMMSFSTQCCDCPDFIDIGRCKISFKVSVTDLDPKRPRTLLKRKLTEKKLIEVYEKYLNEKKGSDPTTL